MNESSLPPLNSHSNVPFILVAVAMLGVAGVLLWLKQSTKTEPPSPPAVSASAVARERPARRPAPPPPPPPEVAEERASEAGTRRAPVQQPRQSACSTPCGGNTNPTLESQLAARSQQSRTCYQRALRTSETLRGKLVVELLIGSDGQVCQASIGADSLGDPSVGSCVLQRFQSKGFPKPTGGCVNVRVPMNFMPDR